MEFAIPLLTTLIPALPLYLIWIVGIVLAVIHRGRDRRVAILTAVALLLFLALDIGNRVMTIAAPTLMQERSFETVSMLLAAMNILSTLVSAGAWIMVLVAIFAGRD